MHRRGITEVTYLGCPDCATLSASSTQLSQSSSEPYESRAIAVSIPVTPTLGVPMRIAFLGHDQPLGVRPAGGFLSKESAEMIVRNLGAERLSKKVIRAFPPDTAFHHLGPAPASASPISGSGEINNCRFRDPQDPTWQLEHGMPSRFLKTRARLMRLALGFDKPPRSSYLTYLTPISL